MSLVPTYAQAVDGWFYKEPTWRGEGWFICLDDDDPPELVMYKSLKKLPQDILREAGFVFDETSVEFVGESGRLYKDISEGVDFIDSMSYFFHLKGRTPVPTEHEGKVKKGSWHECVYYAFDA